MSKKLRRIPNPFHPGEFLLDRFLAPGNITQAEFARKTRWGPRRSSGCCCRPSSIWQRPSANARPPSGRSGLVLAIVAPARPCRRARIDVGLKVRDELSNGVE